jgi:hypothetical protein
MADHVIQPIDGATQTQMFKKSIRLWCYAQHGKGVVEEFLENLFTAASVVVAQETKKEMKKTVPLKVLLIRYSQQTENKQVIAFTPVTLCTARLYQIYYFLILETQLSGFNQPVCNLSYLSVSSSRGTTIRDGSQPNHAVRYSFA